MAPYFFLLDFDAHNFFKPSSLSGRFWRSLGVVATPEGTLQDDAILQFLVMSLADKSLELFHG
ncbi:hypothetical protein Trco_001008 [Trichoderma cornu-damae]|uniref:Uncharacterized protein n=1 Tax=Trichoderma cornu-damae TaxID=654480 RepID=A0A9P8TZT3_9HYPO|nr:hypothetical protein Trco_001008 [Trichoderma cornu-damae]